MGNVVNLANARMPATDADSVVVEACGTCGSLHWHLVADGSVLCAKCRCHAETARWRYASAEDVE